MVKDKFEQQFKVGDTVIYMRSRANSLHIASIMSINANGNSQIIDEWGNTSTLLLTRTHRITVTTTPAHINYMKRNLTKFVVDEQGQVSENIKNFLSI